MKSLFLAAGACMLFSPCLAQSWSALESGSDSQLKAVHFVNENQGYASGTLGTVLKTENQGDSWTNVMLGYEGYWFWDLHFLNADTGYVCGESDPGSMPSGSGVLLKTTNGGATWTPVFSSSEMPFRDLFVLDENTLYVCGGAEGVNGKVFVSHDKGATWSPIGLTYYDSMLGGMYFTSTSQGFMGVYESVYGLYNPLHASWLHSSDGLSFSTEVCSPYGYWNFSSSFGDASNGYMARATYVSSDPVILRKTTDAGSTWVESEVPDIHGGGTGIGLDFLDANTGYMVGGAGAIVHTTDGGTTWESQSSGVSVDLRSVSFVNTELGFAVGDEGTILRYSKSSTPAGFGDKALVENLLIYPNPSSAFVEIKGLELGDQVAIYDASGKKCLSFTAEAIHTKIDLSNLEQGVYQIVRLHKKGLSHGKFVKQ